MSSIVVATITYRRPETLARLLRSLETLEQLPAGWKLDAHVVVDNDPTGSAESTVRRSSLDIHYVIEDRPGVSHARNKAIEFARSRGVSWIAFIDDDEEAQPRWLAELAEATRPDSVCVVGAVNIHYPPATPTWIPATGVFRSEPVDGSQVDGLLMAGNCMLRIDPPAVNFPMFPEDFSTTGGEDWVLGRRLLDAGHQIDYAPRAIADETVLTDRINPRYVFHRLLRLGNTLARTELSRDSLGPLVRFRMIAEGLGRVGYGLLRGLVNVRGGTPGIAAGLRTSVIGIGQIAGALGVAVHGYRQKN